MRIHMGSLGFCTARRDKQTQCIARGCEYVYTTAASMARLGSAVSCMCAVPASASRRQALGAPSAGGGYPAEGLDAASVRAAAGGRRRTGGICRVQRAAWRWRLRTSCICRPAREQCCYLQMLRMLESCHASGHDGRSSRYACKRHGWRRAVIVAADLILCCSLCVSKSQHMFCRRP